MNYLREVNFREERRLVLHFFQKQKFETKEKQRFGLETAYID